MPHACIEIYLHNACCNEGMCTMLATIVHGLHGTAKCYEHDQMVIVGLHSLVRWICHITHMHANSPVFTFQCLDLSTTTRPTGQACGKAEVRFRSTWALQSMGCLDNWTNPPTPTSLNAGSTRHGFNHSTHGPKSLGLHCTVIATPRVAKLAFLILT